MKTHKASKILIIGFLSIVAIGQLFPLVWLVNFSLAKSGDLFGAHILMWPKPPQWKNYVTAWVDGRIPQYLFNSVIVNVISIALTVLLSTMMAYAFTRMKWKWRNTVMNIILLGIMVPIHATLLPNYISFSALKLTDSYIGLIIPYTAFSLSLATFIMTGFMHTVPKSIEESAFIEGCGIFKILFKIIFPLIRPAMVTIIIMTFINTWNEFIMTATYISKESLRTLPYAVYNFAGKYAANYSVQFAVMALVALPTLIVYALMSDQITKGIAEGALKG